MNQLRWQPWTAPGVWQPHPTVFALADAAGIATCQVSSPTFQHTPLTKVALSGGTFHGRLTGEERMDLAADRLAAADRTLVYTYYSELDAMGHRHGVDSDAWRGQLMMVDRLAERLAEQLPPRGVLYITADHGMIDIPFDEESRVDFDEDWELRAGVAVLGGEGRARHVYAVPGAAADVLAVWSEVLGDRMWVAEPRGGRRRGVVRARPGAPGARPDRRRGGRRPRRHGGGGVPHRAGGVQDDRTARLDDPRRATRAAARSTLLRHLPPPSPAVRRHPSTERPSSHPCPSWSSSPEPWTAARAPSPCRSSTTAPPAASSR